jgi:hypothetical protein
LGYRNIAASVVRALLKREPQQLGKLSSFAGAGIYALYYAGEFEPYGPVAKGHCEVPIYVGKAIPPGARRGADEVKPPAGRVLFRRLREHSRSIEQADNLRLDDFLCRYLRVKHVWIPLAERILVQSFRPVWNTVIDGFGNHPPGRGRRNMRRPRWDIVHPGREWAFRLERQEDLATILAQVAAHLREHGQPPSGRPGQDDG